MPAEGAEANARDRARRRWRSAMAAVKFIGRSRNHIRLDAKHSFQLRLYDSDSDWRWDASHCERTVTGVLRAVRAGAVPAASTAPSDIVGSLLESVPTGLSFWSESSSDDGSSSLRNHHHDDEEPTIGPPHALADLPAVAPQPWVARHPPDELTMRIAALHVLWDLQHARRGRKTAHLAVEEYMEVILRRLPAVALRRLAWYCRARSSSGRASSTSRSSHSDCDDDAWDPHYFMHDERREAALSALSDAMHEFAEAITHDESSEDTFVPWSSHITPRSEPQQPITSAAPPAVVDEEQGTAAASGCMRWPNILDAMFSCIRPQPRRLR